MVVSVVWDIDSYIYAMIDNVKTNFTCKLSIEPQDLFTAYNDIPLIVVADRYTCSAAKHILNSSFVISDKKN